MPRVTVSDEIAATIEVTSFEANRGYTITHYKLGTRIDTMFSIEAEHGPR